MADTSLTIANRALQHCGARSVVASFDEDSNEARNLKLIFDSTERETLSKVRWNFTSTYANGVGVTVALPPQWRYAFALPSDLLAMRALYLKPPLAQGVPIFGNTLLAVAPQNGGKVPYALGVSGGQRVILCNVPACVVWYTAAASDFNLWQPLAIQMLEYALAAKLAIPLSGDKALAQLWEQKHLQVMQAAQTLDANDDTSIQDVPPDWLLVREGFGDGEDTCPPVAPDTTQFSVDVREF